MDNIRITLENSDGHRFFCILEKAADYTGQFEEVFSVQKGYGFSVECYPDKVELRDYFAGETRATFRILKTEATEQAVSRQLQKTEE